jgi:hypothetical protein
MYGFVILVSEFEQKIRPHFIGRTGALKSWRQVWFVYYAKLYYDSFTRLW